MAVDASSIALEKREMFIGKIPQKNRGIPVPPLVLTLVKSRLGRIGPPIRIFLYI